MTQSFRKLEQKTLLSRFFINYRRQAIYKVIRGFHNLPRQDRIPIFLSDIPLSRDIGDYKFQEIRFKDIDLQLLETKYRDSFVVFYIDRDDEMHVLKSTFAFNGMSGTIKSHNDSSHGWLVVVPENIEILGRLSNSIPMTVNILSVVFKKISLLSHPLGSISNESYKAFVASTQLANELINEY